MAGRTLNIGTVFSAIDKVTGPIKKISGSVQKFQDQNRRATSGLTSSFSGLRGAMAGVAATLTVGAITNQVMEYTALADTLGKVSKNLGLSVESLQEYRYAAGLADVSAEELDQSFFTLSTNLGKMAVGQGKLAKFLARSNPALAAQLKAANGTEEAFNLVVDAISKAPNEAQRMALATAAFGGSAQKMLTFVRNGVPDIEKMREEFRLTGAVITDDAAASAEEFNDTLTRLKTVGMGLIYSFIGPLIKALNPLLVSFQKWTIANRQLIGSGLDTFFEGLSIAARGFFTVLGAVLSVVLKINDAFGGYLLPLIVGAIVVFKAITIAIAAYNAVLAIMTAVKLAAAAAGGILNAVFLLSPIGWVIAGIVALIAVGILLYKNWDKIAAYFREFWWELQNDPKRAIAKIIQIITFFTPLGLFMALWEPVTKYLKETFGIDIPGIFASMWDGIIDIFVGAKDILLSIIDSLLMPLYVLIDALGIVENAKGGLSALFGSGPQAGVPASANSGMIESQNNSNSTVDVNFNNAPKGTQMRQQGRAPGVRLNMGKATG